MIKHFMNIKAAEEQIERLFNELGRLDPDSEEYSNNLNRIEKLSEIRNELKNGGPGRLSDIRWEQLLTSGIGLLGVLVILKYEEENVITSKAFNIATKMLGR